MRHVLKRPGPRRKDGKEASRLRIFLWAALLGLLFGAIDFGEPLEDSLRIARNSLRPYKASGEIVLVSIDDSSLEKLGAWPWPRRYHAAMADELKRLGARKIMFDIDFSSPSSRADDAAFEAALARAEPKVTLANRFVLDPVLNQRRDALPLPAFARHAATANINFEYSSQSSVWRLPYALEVGGKSYPSFAAELAGSYGETGEAFPIDYAIDPRSIPTVSAVDLIEGRVPAARLAGKDVVIGTTSLQLGDIYFLPGYGRMSGVYLHMLGAETLKAGPPIVLGWFAPFLLALLVSGCCLFFIRSVPLCLGALAGAAISLLLIPFVLESYLIFANVTAALFLLIAVGGTLAWKNFRQSYRLRDMTNAISGLPNLNALRQEKVAENRTLIAARIGNYAEIASALPADQEKTLVEQVAARLTLGASNPKLYQGDEGIFAWFSDPGISVPIGDHLDALQALFRSAVVVGGNPFDLAITFGIDADDARSPANRLNSALVAADEAASEGLRWKKYDPEKLKDAAWKLSLLSQLEAAIDSGDVWVAYQPKLDLESRRLIGAEALVRWTHPEKGPISPMEFVLAAEQHGRIETLTDYVLDRAIEAAASINRRGIDFEMSVNLSARLIADATLSRKVMGLLAKHGLAPDRLTLEVTETAALATSGSDLEPLHQLRAEGVQISIDDYGTGLSTLGYLKKIPATELKIDRTFVQLIDKSNSDRLMVHSTIQLAHSLGQKVVAEGVERPETLEALVQMECDIAQGFLIGRPVPLKTLVKLVVAEHRKQAA